MLKFYRLRVRLNGQLGDGRRCISKAKPNPETFLFHPKRVEIDENFLRKLETKEVTMKHHSGLTSLPTVTVPADLANVIRSVLRDHSRGDLKREALVLDRHLQSRRLPAENEERQRIFERKWKESEKEIQEKLADGTGNITAEDVMKRIDKRALSMTKTSIYNWSAMSYDDDAKCAAYCFGRFAAEFAVLRRILNEIVVRRRDFRPAHMLDFGSGIGTAVWACEHTWPSVINEYLCVDSSASMNDFASRLLNDGDVSTTSDRRRKVTFGQFLSAGVERKYSLVLSAFSLFELPSYRERMRVIDNLWSKTEQFLVIVERGTLEGYRAVLEARDFVLVGGREIYRKQLLQELQARPELLGVANAILGQKEILETDRYAAMIEALPPDVHVPTLVEHGHVFAPCPHDFGCPRLQDRTPCNFAVKFNPLVATDEPESSTFAYVVLQKGPASTEEKDARWPRIVREPRRSRNCVWCQFCSPHGVLEDRQFNKGKNARTKAGMQYRLIQRSDWGDTSPLRTFYDDDGNDGEKDAEQHSS